MRLTMDNSCNNLKIRTVKISELETYSNLKSNDLIQIVETSSSNLYSRKTTFGDFVNSISQLTASLSGSVKGNFQGFFTGSIYGNLSGSVTGNFQGNLNNCFGSIQGIPFKKLNNKDISFDGKAFSSVTSSFSPLSDFTKKSINSEYGLTSSYSKYIRSLNAKTSSVCLNSIYSVTSSLSNNSYTSDTANNTEYSNYAKEVSNAITSSYSLFAENALTSSYSISSSLSTTSSFVTNKGFAQVRKTSYAKVSNYALSGNIPNFDMVFYSTFNKDSTNAGAINRFKSNNQLASYTTAQENKWQKVTLNKTFVPNIKIPSEVTHISVTFYFKYDDNTMAILIWSPDPYDRKFQPKIVVDRVKIDVHQASEDLDYYQKSLNLILPVKPGVDGNPPSFYYKAKGYTNMVIYIQGFIPKKQIII